MKHNQIISHLQTLLTDYKSAVDELTTDAVSRRANIESQKAIYSEEYFNSMLSRCDEITTSKLNLIREKYEPLSEHYFNLLKREMNSFFKGKIDPEIVSKAQTIKAVGLNLSQKEFDILLESAKSYYDLRVLGQLAEDMKLKFDSGVNDFFSDIDKAYTYYEQYKGAVSTALKYYAGENNELKECVPPDVNGNKAELWLLGSASAFMDERASEKMYIDTMEKIYSVLPERKVKTELTDNDRRLVDSIIDVKYPSLAGEQVKNICAYSDDLAEIFALDERYSKYVEEFYDSEANDNASTN